MKIYYLILAVLFTATTSTIAQNAPPTIKDILVKVDSTQKFIEVSYCLEDIEDQEIEVLFKVSNDNGQTFSIDTELAKGDVGAKVAPGKNKKIIWDYGKSGISLDKAKWRIVADDYYAIDIDEIVAKVDADRLSQRLKTFAIVRNHETKKGKNNLKKIRGEINDLFTTFGMDIRQQDFEFGTLNGTNIIGTLSGQKDENKTFNLLTHYDAVKGSPGANANATGVVAMMEIAEILSQYNSNYSLAVATLDLGIEEYRGAINYVYEGGILETQEVLGGMSIDAIGIYNDKPNTHIVRPEYRPLIGKTYEVIASQDFRANFVSCIGNEKSIPLQEKFEMAATKYVPELRVIYPTAADYGESTYFYQDSDHSTFWYYNLQALYVSDGGLTRNPKNNSKEDTHDKIDFEFMAKITKASLATIAQIIEIKHSTIYEERFIENNSDKELTSKKL